jgi:hypothetical protein
MSATSKERGARDDDRIDTVEEQKRWAAKFGVTRKELKAAIDEVGPKAEDVQRYLRDRAGSPRSA